MCFFKKLSNSCLFLRPVKVFFFVFLLPQRKVAKASRSETLDCGWNQRSPYGCKSPTKHDKKVSTSLCFVPAQELNRIIEDVSRDGTRKYQVISHGFIANDFWPDDEKTEHFSAKSLLIKLLFPIQKIFHHYKRNEILFADHLGIICRN